MHAGDRPVMKPGDSERATVAHAFAQDSPRPRQIAPVLPDRPGNPAVMVGFLFADPVRFPPDPQIAAWAAAAVNQAAPRAVATGHHAAKSTRSEWVYTLKR